MKDIKKDERYKAVEEMFSGKAKRRSGHGSGGSAVAEDRSVAYDCQKCLSHNLVQSGAEPQTLGLEDNELGSSAG